jgi:hypothetical protein
MGMGATDTFWRTAAEETLGLTYNKDAGALEGWGKQFTGRGVSNLPSRQISGAKAGFGSGILGSGLRAVGGAPLAAYFGYSDGGGMFGLGNALAADFVTSGMIGTMAATGAVGVGTQFAVGAGGGMVGGMVGGLVGGAVAGPLGASVGMSWGSAGGVWVAKQIATTGARALLGSAMTNPYAWAAGLTVAAGIAVAAGVYGTAKGSYELLKAGYGHKQKMRHKIDSAGSTAAFMSKNAFTMRSRAVESIRNNHLNARSAIGHEATSIHFAANRRWAGGKVY